MKIDQVFTSLLTGPGWKPRSGQVEMARTVGTTMMRGGAALIEAPCGTGKTFAYLVPPLLKQRRVMVATAGLSLQDQLVKRDVPFLARAMGRDGLVVASAKGRANYLCRLRMDRTDLPLSYTRDNVAEQDAVLAWASDPGCSGDRSEFRGRRVDDVVWRALTVPESGCLGLKCPHHDTCFYTQARNRWAKTDVLVVNYHLLWLWLRFGRVPGHDLVVLDEAHRAADIARQVLGTGMTPQTLEAVNLELQELGGMVADVLLEAWASWWRGVSEHSASERDQIRFRSVPKGTEEIRGLVQDVAGTVRFAAGEAERSGDEERVKRCLDLEHRLERVDAVLHLLQTEPERDDPEYVLFPGESDRSFGIEVRRLDPAPVLSELFRGRAVVACSATMRDGSGFGFIRSELGVPEQSREVVLESPFRFEAQAVGVTPPVPSARSPEHSEAVARVAWRVARSLGGKTMVLATSNRAKDEVGRFLRDFGVRVAIQGEKGEPKQKQIGQFRAGEADVLVGVASFWEGVDLPGQALRAVVVAKLPFPHPGDPVLDGLSQRAGESAFWTVSLPRAVLTLRQGAGRLIRTETDTGLFVVCDDRFGAGSKRYTAAMKATLPFRWTTDLDLALRVEAEMAQEMNR